MPKSAKDASYSQQHVQERALERYALTLLADDYGKLNEAVQRARSSEGESNAAVTESAGSELEPSPAPGAMAFYPTSFNIADKNGLNTRPGTVVDKGVTAVFDFDFYLQAHAGIQGTVIIIYFVQFRLV
ncbi:hypothetical protein DFH08DRAFT_977898 [Mycena albidolilacea]|uniref:Uncharacterized protein n=1 Tax=Mycena albidolilacea TaxID=1033008 RepID=A0AAD6YZN9_9AGAR|nr:hypothetical protein DFH08DRAFT_977898 [Mycena albidolilacea]